MLKQSANYQKRCHIKTALNLFFFIMLLRVQNEDIKDICLALPVLGGALYK
jgi:hypothetical protein